MLSLLTTRAPPSSQVQSRLLLVDCGRAVAAFAVLFWHYHMFFLQPGQSAPPGTIALPLHPAFALFYDYGLYAVPIFWVISGFVFSRVYLGTNVSTRDFMVNRFARLYPLHFLTLLVMAALQTLAVVRFGTWIGYGNNDVPHFALQLAFASNWFNHDFSFNGPIWSVSVEIVIYAVFWIAHRWLRGPLLSALASLAFLQLFRMDGGNWTAQCGFCFFLGVTLEVSRSRLAAIALFVAGLALIYFGRLQFGVPALFGGILLGLVELETFIPVRWAPLLTAIGDNTYGMYLWHVPIIITLLLLIGTPLASAASSAGFLLVFLATVIVVARVSFVWFEKPMRRRIRRWSGGCRKNTPDPRVAAP